MATRYWVGGNGTWNSTNTTNWSTTSGGSGGASVPGSADTAQFDVAGTFTVTIASTAPAIKVVFADVNYNFSMSGNVNFGTNSSWYQTKGTLSLNGYTLTLKSYVAYNANPVTLAFGAGNIVLSAATSNLEITANNFNYTGTFAVSMTDTSGGQRNISLTSTYFTESTAPSIGSSGTNINITNTGQMYIEGRFANIAATNFTGQFVLYPTTVYGNFTLNVSATLSGYPSTGQLTFAATSGTQTVTTNGVSLGCPVVISSNKVQFVSAATVNDSLTFTSGTLELTSGATFSVNSFTTTGSTLKYLQATSAGTRAVLYQSGSGLNAVTYLSIKDNEATGGATWDATASTNVNAGNVLGWKFNVPNMFFFL